ncbi:hypothetical protein C8F04DRAFT_1132317 [Mycena alexandri]|uniref:Uncharacterized protein n=1 Tax=Mycena alexandri TaxID=1745969 RepID=A0AAD6WR82_9AGAR|nr:hypothetical protein C8F04DRAFT_1132317 [Mycena alexandri]
MRLGRRALRPHPPPPLPPRARRLALLLPVDLGCMAQAMGCDHPEVRCGGVTSGAAAVLCAADVVSAPQAVSSVADGRPAPQATRALGGGSTPFPFAFGRQTPSLMILFLS